MDLFHIKLFSKQKKITSIVYLVETDISKSRFINVEDYKNFLDRPGINPLWLDKVLEIQQSDLIRARQYVLKVIENEVHKNNSDISTGFSWDQSEYRYDEFMSSVLNFTGFIN